MTHKDHHEERLLLGTEPYKSENLLQSYHVSIPPVSLNEMRATAFNAYAKKIINTKTKKYASWQNLAMQEMMIQRIKYNNPPAINHDIAVLVSMKKCKGDLDNRLKALFDALEKLHIIKNDKQIVNHINFFNDHEGVIIDLYKK